MATDHARGAETILLNQTGKTARFQVEEDGGTPVSKELAAGGFLAIRFRDQGRLLIQTEKGVVTRSLEKNAAYHLVSTPGGFDVKQVQTQTRTADVVVVPVKILVDDNEPSTQRRWEERLRARVAAASKIFQKNFLIRFDVVAVETWKSGDKLDSFDGLFQEFYSTVDPRPARVAIGFFSQHPAPGKNRLNLGGIPGPFGRHVLIWERPLMSEPERLEVLVHELGHFLGAPHSADPGSVMRPELGDGKARSKHFDIVFDPAATLILHAVAKEFRTRNVRSLAELTEPNKRLLRDILADVHRSLPDDPVANRYAALLNEKPPGADPARVARRKVTDQVREIIAAVNGAASRNRSLPLATATGNVRPYRMEGDELTEFLIRNAVVTARQLPGEQGTKVFLLGIGIALDTSETMRRNPLTRALWQSIETDAERGARLRQLGKPTIYGRHDLAQHFAVSAALTALLGPAAAESLGLQKEIMDSKGGSGFSFVDLSADLAGIEFATAALEAKELPKAWETTFRIEDFFPEPLDRSEGYQWPRFAESFGGPTDPRFRAKVEEIRETIRRAPAFRKSGTNTVTPENEAPPPPSP